MHTCYAVNDSFKIGQRKAIMVPQTVARPEGSGGVISIRLGERHKFFIASTHRIEDTYISRRGVRITIYYMDVTRNLNLRKLIARVVDIR